MFSAHRPRSANAYQRIQFETHAHQTDRLQMVALLYQGVLDAIATARGAMARGDVHGKVQAIAKATRILDEGLGLALDQRAGGALAHNLGALYDYCMQRLILANARNDDAMMREVTQLIKPVAEGWNAIITRPDAAPDARPADVSIASGALLHPLSPGA